MVDNLVMDVRLDKEGSNYIQNPSCPKCKEGHVIKGNKAYGCTRWSKGCDFVISFETLRTKANGRALDKELFLTLLAQYT